ncbi:MAG TPA: hypothetical protein VJU87_04880 [Gemmatimonadaceae bacterium]|nr:hypothetical protein [Gemmatimonadaceae bacterium]
MRIPSAVRRLSLLVTASLLGAVLLLGWAGARPEMSDDAAVQMRRATAYYDSLVVVARAAPSPAAVDVRTVLGLGYLERLRLGLGSPFRLADLALHDPRLGDSTGRRVAWAILGRLRRGDAYVVDPAAADGLENPGNGAAVPGTAQLRLIERAVASAKDPRAGELTVRLAYALAAGERTVEDQGDVVATQIAALTRDRLLAQEDLRNLLQDAASKHTDVLQLLENRRLTRELAVEAPPAEPLDDELQEDAMQAVPALLQRIRDLRSAPPDARHGRPVAAATMLGPAVAARLADLGSRLPPEAPVAVTVRTHRAMLLTPGLPAAVESARERLVTRGLNEESLTGTYGSLLASGDTARRDGAVTVLGVATALRAYAQEAVWFPGMPGPTVADLRGEFGLAGVSFGEDVPAEWRPYYLRMIGTSLDDVRRVLGGLSFEGLRMQVSVDGLPDTVLALHDPRTRTIRLNVATSAGTIAHELAHDLDWQAARRLYATGGYSTDHAVREQRGPLAASMRDLTASGVAEHRMAAGQERPAEVFARNVDWLVAVSLAREGRSDGYLTAVQDAALTGYTTVSPVAMIAGAARPLVDAVQEMTYLPERVRDEFLAQWADPASIDPYLIVRHVLGAPFARVRVSHGSGFFPDPEMLLAAGDASLCSVESPSSPQLRMRQMLLDMALDARARGIARARARYYGEAWRPAWARSVLQSPPWSAEPGEQMVRRIRAVLAAQLESAATSDQLVFPTLSIFRTTASSCSSNLF